MAPEPETQPPPGYRFDALSSRQFFAAKYTLEWLVGRVLVAGQPAVVGGPKKSLKTSLLIDLAVSLATATPFLGRFDVYKKHRVVLISGESGEAVLQETGRRVCRARGVSPEELSVWWTFSLPQVGNALDRQRLHAGLRDLQADVVILDPLYLALLSGFDARDVEAGNLYKMGPLLSDLSRVCLGAGCTPVLAHHARKGTARSGEPLDLDDLSFAGIAEFARQWVLLNRRENFDPNTGANKLWLSVGGSAGQGGCWAVDVAEGTLNEDFSGRTWDVTVQNVSEHKDSLKAERNKEKQARDDEKRQDDEHRFMTALDRLDPAGRGASVNQVRIDAGLHSDRAIAAMQRLVQARVIECLPAFLSPVGNGGKRTSRGVRRLTN